MMKSYPMFPDKLLVTNPRVIVREELPANDFRFVTKRRLGDYYLVIPCNAREVIFLQLLGKNIGCWLPLSGEGLLIQCDSLKGL